MRRGENRIALTNLSIYYTWKNIKSSYNNDKFKISAPTWNDKFELPDGSYSASDIQDYFEYILKKHGENIDNPSVKVYVNNETMKLLESTENKITKDKNGKNIPHLEIAEVVLVHCNIGNNDYQ